VFSPFPNRPFFSSIDTYRNHGARFERHKAAFEEGGGDDDAFFDNDDDDHKGAAVNDDEKVA